MRDARAEPRAEQWKWERHVVLLLLPNVCRAVWIACCAFLSLRAASRAALLDGKRREPRVAYVACQGTLTELLHNAHPMRCVAREFPLISAGRFEHIIFFFFSILNSIPPCGLRVVAIKIFIFKQFGGDSPPRTQTHTHTHTVDGNILIPRRRCRSFLPFPFLQCTYL